MNLNHRARLSESTRLEREERLGIDISCPPRRTGLCRSQALRPFVPVLSSLLVSVCACLIAAMAASSAAYAERPLERLVGAQFTGGARHVFGGQKFGVAQVNYVYAQSTAGAPKPGNQAYAPTNPASMVGVLRLGRVPEKAVSLFLHGRDDDAEAACPIHITLNGKDVFAGENPFPSDRFGWHAFPLEPGMLRKGDNLLCVSNTAPEGKLGMPPWFMLAACEVARAGYDPEAPLSIEEDFRVDLPREKLPMPTPLPVGKQPGFAVRGMKGWVWRPEQYLAEVPVLAEYRMNFLMLCYGSMFDIERFAWTDPRANRWWEPLPPEKKRAYEDVLHACQDAGIYLCLSMNPMLFTQRPLDPASPEDLDALWQHYQWMQRLGMKWFALCLDDITEGIDATGHVAVVNGLFQRLRRNDPEAQMIFCPTYYSGDGSGPEASAYLETLGARLHPDVYLFWTGDAVVTPVVTRATGAAYKARARRRLFLWDNYPVNDAHPTMHLGPVTGREAGVAEVCDGYMLNPLHTESEINRLPMLTCADFAYNPWDYDAGRSIGQAILHVADSAQQRRVLRDLVELYPGMLLCGGGTGFNPALARFNEILGRPHQRYLAEMYLRHFEQVIHRLDAAFPNRFAGAKRTLGGNRQTMQAAYEKRYGTAR